MTTPVENFALVTVDGLFGASDTSIDLLTGHGSRLPDPASDGSFPLFWWDAETYSNPADDPNREIVLVTSRTGDTLDTIVRAQEGTSGSTKNTAGKTYKMALGITKRMWEDVNRRFSQTARGLCLGTHFDSDKAASQIRLFHADSIAMSDGEEVANWDNVDFDIAAAAGIGALDTGSEAASTWYELYAMYNGTTKGLMGHRAKDYLADVSYTAGEDASQGLRDAVDNSTIKIAQGVVPATSGPLKFIELKLLKTGTPTGNYWVTLISTNAGNPTGALRATSYKYDAARLTTSGQWVRIVFPEPYSVSASNQYFIILQADYAVSASNFISWRMDGSAGAYTGGTKNLYDSDTDTWTNVSDDDMMFRLYIEENNTALTIPAGYKSALLGYFFNNGSSNIRPYLQRGAQYRLTNPIADGLVFSELAAAGTLYDLREHVPPLDMITAIFQLTGTGAAAATASLGDIRATDLSNSGVSVGAQASLEVATTAERPSNPVEVVLPYSGVMVDATSGADLHISGFNL